MVFYLLVFLASLVVDLLPFFGPPAWTVMAFLQVFFGLNIWWVLVCGVLGSTLGRYLFSLYIPLLFGKFIAPQKSEDLRFIGTKLGEKGWKVQLFIFLYTLVPLPTTSLFTASGLAKIKPIQIIPPFLLGKFISDTVMVLAGEYAAENATGILCGMVGWKSISGLIVGVLMLAFLLFVDWHYLLQQKKFRFSFRIWK
jgi:membrane protein YqaA with SNARE-associated domain